MASTQVDMFMSPHYNPHGHQRHDSLFLREIREYNPVMETSFKHTPRNLVTPRKLRCGSSSADGRLSIYSTSGTPYESVNVIGHIYGFKNVVYYLIEVRSIDQPLEGYVIRRRYSEFKEFHAKLADHMQLASTYLPRQSFQTHIGAYGLQYSSLLCYPMRFSAVPEVPMWSPRRSENIDYHRRHPYPMRRGLRYSGVAMDRDFESSSMCGENYYQNGTDGRYGGDLEREMEPESPYFNPRQSAPTVLSRSNIPDACQLPAFDSVRFSHDGRPLLPEMPHGGLFTLFTPRQTIISQRISQFNKILASVICDTNIDVATLLMNFIQENPQNQSNYVRLADYGAIDMPSSVERHARRERAASMGKKALRESITAASDL